jgi:hypothetical protein
MTKEEAYTVIDPVWENVEGLQPPEFGLTAEENSKYQKTQAVISSDSNKPCLWGRAA